MLKPSPRLQPSYYDAFRCVGAVCEDTCCSGWRVPVDKDTFEKYQTCSHAALGPKLHNLVNIASRAESENSWAEIKLNQGICPFLTGGLCEIQATLGEALLSKNCATYPRVMTSVEGILERSLHISCPEAARLALTNPQPLEFVSSFENDGNERLGNIGIVDTANPREPGRAFRHLHEVRNLLIALLQNRSYPLSDRLLILGRLCDKLESEGTEQGCESLHEAARQSAAVRPRAGTASAARFETVIELILARLGADATSRRFLNCYQSFMSGLRWTMDSTMEQLAANLEAAFAGPFADFRAAHGYMLEHYLVSYVFRSLFPFGSLSANCKLAQNNFQHSVSGQYKLMVVYFVIVETLLAGVAAFHAESFSVADALTVIQSATKTFEHSVSYPGKAIELLNQKGLLDCAAMSQLIRG